MGVLQSTESALNDENTVASQNVLSTEADLADVLILLANFNSSKIPIPLPLVVEIMNYAGILSPLLVENEDSSTSGNNCDLVHLSLRLPRDRYVKPISIQLIVSSKDQGWSSYPSQHGTRSSHTWGELCLSSDSTQRVTAFRNIHAGRKFEPQVIDIPLSKDAPEQFKPLVDSILSLHEEAAPTSLNLILRSMYPGWTISVEYASLSVKYELAGDWEAFVAHCALMRGH
eukprot:CAMPEP_0184991004 /NCGR_PEP_ID=MMETSP1098-20130426/34847_1 /TAXON_ID=89044 /ORGANISM="Spumella elongata, Strain CCAP 955/1" /LENGTH=228 /DNA_ID=CAMNT_0027516325 /DNA_START=17 /DNA_END=703 /DNA_ORIENTATION=+